MLIDAILYKRVRIKKKTLFVNPVYSKYIVILCTYTANTDFRFHNRNNNIGFKHNTEQVLVCIVATAHWL